MWDPDNPGVREKRKIFPPPIPTLPKVSQGETKDVSFLDAVKEMSPEIAKHLYGVRVVDDGLQIVDEDRFAELGRIQKKLMEPYLCVFNRSRSA